MPLGIVSDEQFEFEIKAIHKDVVRGRGAVPEVPEVIREIIAEDAILTDKTIAEVASAHGVSTASVSAYKNGATSTASYHEPSERLQKKNDKVRSEIIGTARSRLMEALRCITPEKLAEAKPRDLASVAKDMSAVIHNTEPQVSNTQVSAQFIFHSHQNRKESDFDIIDVTQ